LLLDTHSEAILVEEADPHVNALGIKGVGEIGITSVRSALRTRRARSPIQCGTERGFAFAAFRITSIGWMKRRSCHFLVACPIAFIGPTMGQNPFGRPMWFPHTAPPARRGTDPERVEKFESGVLRQPVRLPKLGGNPNQSG
jgi:hypothetical protein